MKKLAILTLTSVSIILMSSCSCNRHKETLPKENHSSEPSKVSITAQDTVNVPSEQRFMEALITNKRIITKEWQTVEFKCLSKVKFQAEADSLLKEVSNLEKRMGIKAMDAKEYEFAWVLVDDSDTEALRAQLYLIREYLGDALKYYRTDDITTCMLIYEFKDYDGMPKRGVLYAKFDYIGNLFAYSSNGIDWTIIDELFAIPSDVCKTMYNMGRPLTKSGRPIRG